MGSGANRNNDLQDGRPRLGLALSGGSAWGFAHIGVLEILTEQNISVDLIAGTSAGAIIGALIAGGMSVQNLHQAVLGLDWKDLAYFEIPKHGFLSSGGIERFVESCIGKKTFADLDLPLSVLATDLHSGEEVLLNQGPVARAVRASASLPVLFAPIDIGDRLLVDGGLVNNLPVAAARNMGAQVVVAVDVSRALSGPPESSYEVGFQALNIMLKSQVDRAAEAADLVIRPDLQDIGPAAISEAGAIIEIGRQAAQDAIPRLQTLLSKARSEKG